MSHFPACSSDACSQGRKPCPTPLVCERAYWLNLPEPPGAWDELLYWLPVIVVSTLLLIWAALVTFAPDWLYAAIAGVLS